MCRLFLCIGTSDTPLVFSATVKPKIRVHGECVWEVTVTKKPEADNVTVNLTLVTKEKDLIKLGDNNVTTVTIPPGK